MDARNGPAARPVRAVAVAVAIALALWSPGAPAQDWITVSVASYHLTRSEGRCEFNPGVGGELELSRAWRLVAGAYRNSHCTGSVYAGAQWLPLQALGLRYGLQPVIITGYNKTVWGPLPLVALERRDWGANLFVVPKVQSQEHPGTQARGVVGLQLKFPF